MKVMSDNSVDAIVTDPPAGIGFMGKAWDSHKGGRDAWVQWLAGIMREALRVLKPGGHALIWALPRTSHWTAWALENAGFEIRDRVAFIFGSGFPKSLNVSKAIDKAAGVKRKITGIESRRPNPRAMSPQGAGKRNNNSALRYDKLVTEVAKQWSGFGSALKPAMEDWWLCRKPLSEDSIAANVLKWGVGALNIDGCRIAGETPAKDRRMTARRTGNIPTYHGEIAREAEAKGKIHNRASKEAYLKPRLGEEIGRWPAHVVHDGSPEVLARFPETESGILKTHHKRSGRGLNGTTTFAIRERTGELCDFGGDSGSAARFFYCAKPDRRERGNGNNHPTVKLTKLMRWLCRLITPPDGTVFDPFMGSGSTGGAAVLEDFGFIGIEQDEEYFKIAKRQIKESRAQLHLFHENG